MLASVLALGVLALGTAFAQQSGGTADAATAVSSLNFATMISYIGTGIKTVIADNGPLLVIAMLPLMAFYFIYARLRGLFG